MNTDFINVFFENISHFKYSKEFLESIKMHTTVYEESYSEKTYLDFLEKFEKNVFPEYEINYIQKWNSYRQDSLPRTISLTINERTGELDHVIMSHDELEFKFLKKYIFKKSIIFFDGFSLYNDYAHANSFEQEEYLGYIENFKFHLNSKISRVRFSNQFHILKSILEGLKSYKIFFDSSFELKIIDSQFLDLTQPLKPWEGIKSVIINETQIFKPIEDVPSATDIIEPLLEVFPSPTGENNQINIEPNEKNSLAYYMNSGLKWERLTIKDYIDFLVNFTITKIV